jgi:hypothetical protein
LNDKNDRNLHSKAYINVNGQARTVVSFWSGPEFWLAEERGLGIRDQRPGVRDQGLGPTDYSSSFGSSLSFRPCAGISVLRIGQASCLIVPLFTKEGVGEIIF